MILNASHSPIRISCGESQNTDMGVIPVGSPALMERIRLMRSTNPATIMERIAKTIPVPIRWRSVIPDLWLVIRRKNGTKTRSYKGRKTPMVRREMTEREPAGISKLGPICRSIFKAWETVKVPCCVIAASDIIPADQTGTIRIKHFTSSTSWMLHNRHLFAGTPSDVRSPSIITAALSRNLFVKIYVLPQLHNYQIFYKKIMEYNKISFKFFLIFFLLLNNSKF